MGKRKAELSKGATKLKKQRAEEDRILSAGFNNVILSEEEDDDGGNFSEESDEDENDWENEEQDYENVPRSLVKNKKIVEGLPIKTSEGRIQRIVREQDEEDESEEEDEKDDEDEKPTEEDSKKSEEELSDDEEVYAFSENMTEEEKLIQLQEDIAEMVEKLIEQPEENISSLTRLRKMAQSKNPVTSRYSLLALVSTFKSIVPGYRIRPLSETEKKEKVSKDIAKLRMFEQTLLANYKAYLNILSTNAKSFSKKSYLGRVSITASCELVSSLSHFNFVEDLLNILIKFVCRFRGPLPKESEEPEKLANIKLFTRCISVLQEQLDEDITYGKLSFDVCRLISKSLKQKDYRVNKEVVALYLSLSILSDYDPQNAMDNASQSKLKLKKKDRVHLSKKERKARKERKEIDEEMRKAELQVSREERDRNQAEILKILLSNYLQILKTRNDHLMASVLEGLAKYGFMANLELIGDFLQIMKELIQDISAEEHLTDHRIKQILFCIVTSFTLMDNGNNKIRMDMSKFIDVLYGILLDISMDAEITKSIKLLIRTLNAIFIQTKSSTKIRNLAFTKKIYMLILNTSEKPTLALLGFLSQLIDKAPEIKNMYNIDDRVENGTFVMEADHPSRSNPEAATIWENCLLVNHYCPSISGSAKKVLKQSRSS
ncbi:Noc3 protein [Saccharomycopsis crataegensis]|uniref:Nucleolar complex-associated protein 3 n=1 Tax=Saccharomycopsis crataegensis TaxID=43959 RepID=A0AAV5QTN3_9ASCO|nr:Noc3 protein [Saccharomycopsis crataegensis]